MPRAPASPTGKFLSAFGTWIEAAGGSGVTQHTGLSLLYWTSAGHTGTAGRVAGFAAGTGAATEFALGTDLMAYDAGVNSLTGADTAAGFAYPNGANAWTRLPFVADAAFYASSATALSTFATSTFSRGLMGNTTAPAMQTTLELQHVAFGVDTLEVIAPAIGGNYPVIGLPTAAGFARATIGRVRRGRRTHARNTPAALTDGSIIGGFNYEANNGLVRCDSTNFPEWVWYFFFATNAVAAVRGAAIVGNGTPADTAGGGNNTCGVIRRAANFLGYCTDNGGAQSTGDLGVAPAVDTNYLAEVWFTGGVVKVRLATLDSATGAVVSWSTQVTISANLPASSLGLAPAQKWWVVGTPASAIVDIGGAVYRPTPVFT